MASVSNSKVCEGVDLTTKPENTMVNTGPTPLSVCGLDICQAMKDLKLCANCKTTRYCCKEHQKQHWKVHKTSCSKRIPECVVDKSDAKTSSSNKDEIITSRVDKDGSYVVGGNLTVVSDTVQADIAEFSASISRKHSITLTPCQDVFLSDPIGGIPVEQHYNDKDVPPSIAQTSVSNNTLVQYVSHHMNKFGVCVVDKFLLRELGEAVLREVKALKSDSFHSGQLVLSHEIGSASDIRGDMITWTDGGNPETKYVGRLISKIDSIIHQCKEHVDGFKNISGRTEAMVACYPGKGTHYVKHVDNPNEDGRRITCIYYLNMGWDSETMGGTLRVYPRGSDKMLSIDPVFNRLLFFWSDRRNPHEVRPAHRTRYAITVWYFDAVERRKALETAAT